MWANDNTRRAVLRATSAAVFTGFASQNTTADVDTRSSDSSSDGSQLTGDIHVSNDGTENKPITVRIRDEAGQDVIFTGTVTLPGLNAAPSIDREDATATMTVNAVGAGRHTAEVSIPGEGTATTDVVMTKHGLARAEHILVSVTPYAGVDITSYFD